MKGVQIQTERTEMGQKARQEANGLEVVRRVNVKGKTQMDKATDGRGLEQGRKMLKMNGICTGRKKGSKLLKRPMWPRGQSGQKSFLRIVRPKYIKKQNCAEFYALYSGISNFSRNSNFLVELEKLKIQILHNFVFYGLTSLNFLSDWPHWAFLPSSTRKSTGN